MMRDITGLQTILVILSICRGVCSDCPPGYQFLQSTGYCYKVYTRSGDIKQEYARSLCTADGGDLTSIHSTEEDQFIADLAQRTSGFQETVFIGLMSREGNLKERYWTDGTLFDFTAWGHRKPDNHVFLADNCVILQPGYGWDDWPCDNDTLWTSNAAACKIAATANNTTVTTTADTETLTTTSASTHATTATTTTKATTVDEELDYVLAE